MLIFHLFQDNIWGQGAKFKQFLSLASEVTAQKHGQNRSKQNMMHKKRKQFLYSCLATNLTMMPYCLGLILRGTSNQMAPTMPDPLPLPPGTTDSFRITRLENGNELHSYCSLAVHVCIVGWAISRL